MLNIILDKLPSEFKGHRGVYPLQTDFKQGLKFFKIIADDSLEEATKYEFILVCFFGDGLRVFREDIGPMWDFVSYYVSGGNEEKEEGKRLFDFNVDNSLLYSAFMQVYRIDLRTVGGLHWWTFLELFKGLPAGTRLSEIIDIRGKPIPKSANNEYKTALRNAKAKYSLDKKGDAKANSEAIARLMG